MKENRIYAVKNIETGGVRLIEAASKTAALSFAVRTSLTVDLATQAQLVLLVKNGVEIERAEWASQKDE
jgi:hypothetical protein